MTFKRLFQLIDEGTTRRRLLITIGAIVGGITCVGIGILLSILT